MTQLPNDHVEEGMPVPADNVNVRILDFAFAVRSFKPSSFLLIVKWLECFQGGAIIVRVMCKQCAKANEEAVGRIVRFNVKGVRIRYVAKRKIDGAWAIGP